MRNPHLFLSAVQIGVTVAGFLSSAYGASTVAPDIVPLFGRMGLSESAAATAALVGMTLSLPHSRYPVTGGDVDDVLGFVHVRDLVPADADGDEDTVLRRGEAAEEQPGP